MLRTVRTTRNLKRPRRAVSPVLAELNLLFVSLIAGAAVAGFVVQLMDGSLHPAEVSVGTASCRSGDVETCVLTLTNVGASSVQVTSCAIGSQNGNLNASGGATVPAGGSATVSCSLGGPSGAVDSSLTGWVSLTNGARVYFASRVT